MSDPEKHRKGQLQLDLDEFEPQREDDSSSPYTALILAHGRTWEEVSSRAETNSCGYFEAMVDLDIPGEEIRAIKALLDTKSDSSLENGDAETGIAEERGFGAVPSERSKVIWGVVDIYRLVSQMDDRIAEMIECGENENDQACKSKELLRDIGDSALFKAYKLRGELAKPGHGPGFVEAELQKIANRLFTLSTEPEMSEELARMLDALAD